MADRSDRATKQIVDIDSTCGDAISLYIIVSSLQGLDWYKARLKTDKDGDLADEFLLEPNVGSAQPPDKPLKVSTPNSNKHISSES